ncbi:MAG: UDP-N-acetylmuramyl-tripeptide synthetase [Clostridiales bacterium]|nr:UDP-N-acetylmuramyl-tripeptide synthetase [Clostridiales bacterium]
MNLKSLIEGLEIISVHGDLDFEIDNIAYDSRKAKNGCLFVCIEGFNADGHKFIPSALENGTKALLVQNEVSVPEGVTVIRVNDTRYALAFVSDRLFGHPSGKFKLIGVTGTKGKTTTTYMIKSILEAAGQTVGLVGTLGSRIGDQAIHTERTTPESYDLQNLFADMADKRVDSTVMEVSSQGLELHRVSCCEYYLGVFTNLTQDHISPNEHSSMEEYFNAKLKLFNICKTGLVNIDSSYGEEIVKKAPCKLYTYGIDKDADIKAVNIIAHQDSVEFDAVTPWGSIKVKVSIPGKFSIYNSLAAIGVSCIMGIPFENIAGGLENVTVPGRAEVIPTGQKYTVITDYAHTPDSLENILNTFKVYAEGRLISLFGCGGDRDRTKRPLMGEISGRIADLTIITSDNPRTEEPESIVDEIEKGMQRTKGQYIKILDRREAIKYALANAKPKDIIILAGKGHETYQMFKDKTIHFDEREVVKEILEELGNR